VFFTSTEDGEPATWIVTHHDPERHEVQMVKVTPGVTVCRLEIKVSDLEDGTSEAVVSYTHTSLGPKGDTFVESFTDQRYTAFMSQWENNMNAFLAADETRQASPMTSSLGRSAS
jgi:hypothetical protein